MTWYNESRRHSLAAKGVKTGSKIPAPMPYPKLGIKPRDQIVIVAKRWFDRPNGNTYHSVRVYKNGVLIGENPFEYGYDEAYMQTAHKIMQQAGLFPKTDQYLSSGANKDHYEFEQYRRSHRNQFLSTVSDVSARRDL